MHAKDRIADQIIPTQGCQIPTGFNGYNFERFFLTAEVRDVLDSITAVFYVLTQVGFRNAADRWLTEVATILDEEHLHYRVDERGIVHRFVDTEFEVTRACALEALGDPRFNEARGDFEAAF